MMTMDPALLQPMPARQFTKTDVFPVTRGKFFVFAACILVACYYSAYFYKNDSWSLASLIMIACVIGIGFLISGINVYSCVFATAALLPNLNSFLPFGSFSLTWVEVFMVISIVFFLRKKIRLTMIGISSIGLYVSCVLSLVGSPLGFLSAGILLRFGILLAFTNLLMTSQPDPVLFKAFLYGLLMIPFTSCASYAGEDALAGIFSANFLAFSRAVYSFQYPIWFALIIPFLIYVKAPKFLVLLSVPFIAAVCVLSFARSIIIGAGMSAMFYLAFYKDYKPIMRRIGKTAITLVIIVALVIVTMVLKFLDFNNMDNESNVARYEKMPIAFNKFKQHPFFGAGFGAGNDKALAEKKSGFEVFQEQISAEFGPLTALSEIGAIGSFFLFYLIYLSMRYTIRCLRDRDIAFVFKLIVLITFGGLMSSFLNSNSISAIIVYLFISVPVFFFNNSKRMGELVHVKSPTNPINPT